MLQLFPEGFEEIEHADGVELVAYTDSGATAIPDTAVNPITGEVRLRVSSDGQFATGWLSLSGTVQ